MVRSFLVLASSFFVFKLYGPVVFGVLLAATSVASIFLDTVTIKTNINTKSKEKLIEKLDDIHAALSTNDVAIRPILQPEGVVQRNIEPSIQAFVQTNTQPNIPRENNTNGISMT